MQNNAASALKLHLKSAETLILFSISLYASQNLHKIMQSKAYNIQYNENTGAKNKI